jgi:hypothetical protein
VGGTHSLVGEGLGAIQTTEQILWYSICIIYPGIRFLYKLLPTHGNLFFFLHAALKDTKENEKDSEKEKEVEEKKVNKALLTMLFYKLFLQCEVPGIN